MFALLNRAPRTRKPLTRRTSTLSLERLEDRLCPISINPPEMLCLYITYQPNKQVTLSGDLSNQFGMMPYRAINLGGVVSGTATTNANGIFSATLTASALGNVTAASADGQSNIAAETLVSETPTITSFEVMSEGSGLWYFSGTVANAPTQGEVVNFGGIKPLLGQSVAVNPDGSFDFWAIVPSGQGGWATAQAVDWWGDTSQLAVDAVGA